MHKLQYNGSNYHFIKDLLGNITKVVHEGVIIGEYSYDAWGNQTVKEFSNISDDEKKVLNNNPFRYRGYYYDVKTGLFLLSSRYYSPELCRWISPDDIRYLDSCNIKGLNLYCYSMNNPIGIANSSSSMSRKSNGAMVSSLSFMRLNLDWIAKGLDTGSTIHGLYTSISVLINHSIYFSKNLIPFSDEMTMLGVSMNDRMIAFNRFTWKIAESEAIGVLLGVTLDVYDSTQRGVSTGGVILGATLTAVKGVGLIYLNKGILYGATAIGSCFGPGVGTVVGFVVGGVVCIVVDIFASNWLDDLIDKIAK